MSQIRVATLRTGISPAKLFNELFGVESALVNRYKGSCKSGNSSSNLEK